MKIIEQPIKKQQGFNTNLIEMHMDAGIKINIKNHSEHQESIFYGFVTEIGQNYLHIDISDEENCEKVRTFEVTIEDLKKGTIQLVLERDMFSPRYDSIHHLDKLYKENTEFVLKEEGNNGLESGQMIFDSEGVGFIKEVSKEKLVYRKVDKRCIMSEHTLTASQFLEEECTVVKELTNLDVKRMMVNA